MANFNDIPDSYDEEFSKSLTVTAHYPQSDVYDYEVFLERINLDKEREHDINTNNGFIVDKAQNIKKDLKSDTSIFSSKYGKQLQDADSFMTSHKCKCGFITGTVYEGCICPYCHQKVKYVGDNFEYFGWICIKEDYCLIHPNLYKSLQAFVGAKVLDAIINSDDKIDENGFIIPPKPEKDNPFVGLGMLGFRDNILDIMEFFKNKKPKKIEFYQDIMNNIDKLFIHSIPVYTTQLRPFSIDENSFSFDGNNAIYNVLASQAMRVNKNRLVMKRKGKPEKQILYAMQMNMMEIYSDMESQLSQKKGYVRSLIGGRYNMCSRVVIVPEPELEIDQVTLPYATMIELFQQRIINILSKTMIVAEAYKKWEYGRIEPDIDLYNLMMSIIKDEYVGIILNRNPSIWTKSVLCQRVVGINFNDYACGVPLEILSGLAADFDGDTLNVMYIINKDFLRQAVRVFSPRYAGQISRNNGLFDMSVAHQTNTMISLNSFSFMSRENYSEEQLRKIEIAKAS
jgi:hypothetical protein